jgi:hypothetical protein
LNLSQLEENIAELDKKIDLWEKIIASNYTEAEVILSLISDPQKILLRKKIPEMPSPHYKEKYHPATFKTKRNAQKQQLHD